jgi:hypothetical protein
MPGATTASSMTAPRARLQCSRLAIMLILALACVGLPAAADGAVASAATSYGVRGENILVRSGTAPCARYPSQTNCYHIVDHLYRSRGDRITPSCQKQGQTIGTNPWWVWGRTSHGHWGWMASWWINYPYNKLPGVPVCT